MFKGEKRLTYSTLLFHVEDHVATITIHRPEAANAFNDQMGKELLDAVMRCDTDPAILAVILTGSGSMFCAGGDLKGFAQFAPSEIEYRFKETTTYLHAAVSRMNRMDPPVIAAVNGVAAGAGLSLVCACDLAIAADSARFTMAYTRAGLTPDGSGSYFLTRLVGLRRAMELTLTNRMLSAQEALEWGLINQVVPGEQLMEEAKKLAVQLANGPTEALGAAKHLLYNGWNETLETQMEYESQSIARMAASPVGQEGIRAFVEKRPPRFHG